MRTIFTAIMIYHDSAPCCCFCFCVVCVCECVFVCVCVCADIFPFPCLLGWTVRVGGHRHVPARREVCALRQGRPLALAWQAKWVVLLFSLIVCNCLWVLVFAFVFATLGSLGVGFYSCRRRNPRRCYCFCYHYCLSIFRIHSLFYIAVLWCYLP